MRHFFRKYSIILLLLIVVPFRLYNVDKPLVNITNFRQAQTATIALNFYKNGINLLQTELDIFGIGKERFLTLEFPLYEAAVAFLYKIFFVHDLWGRLVSILSGFIGAWYLYRLVKLILHDEKIAFFSTFFFLFAPLNMFHQRDFLIEPFVICLLLVGAYYFCHFVNYQDKKSFILTTLFLSLGFIEKGMYGPFWLLPLCWYYQKKFSFRNLISLKFLFLIITPLIALYFWQQHVNYINTLAGHEYFTTYNKGHLLWNLGTFADRLSPSLWQFRVKNFLNGIFLKPGLVIFFIGLFAAKQLSIRKFFYVWLGAEVIYFLTFFPIQSHIYYQMVMIPVISVFTAVGLLKIGSWSRVAVQPFKRLRSFKRYINSIFITIFCAFFLWKSYLNSQWDAYPDWKWYERVQKVGKAVRENSNSIFVNPGYDWNSVYTYYPRLKLMLVGAEKVSPQNLKYWHNLGYSYLILHEYDKYPDYFKEIKVENSLDFLKEYKEVLTLEDFKVYLLNI